MLLFAHFKDVPNHVGRSVSKIALRFANICKRLSILIKNSVARVIVSYWLRRIFDALQK